MGSRVSPYLTQHAAAARSNGLCYDLYQMLRRIDYRHAVNGFVFTGLWFVIGAIALWSPIPRALGIAGEMFAAWLMLFFVILSVAGSVLTIAALNAAFPAEPASPPRERTPRARSAGAPIWAPPSPSGSLRGESSTTSRGSETRQREG